MTGAIPDDASAIRDLLEQEYPSKKYEIIAVDISREKLHAHISSLPVSNKELPLARTVEPNQNFGTRMESAMQSANGRIICFANTSCRLQTDWLLSLYIAYERYPHAGGVGGYVQVDKENLSIYDEINYYELGTCLGVEGENKFLSKLYEVENRLFYRNPVGNLANMSYRKELILNDLSFIQSVSALEQYLKVNMMSVRPLCFIPKSVARLTRVGMRDFLHLNYEAGLLNRILRNRITACGKYRSQSLISAVMDAMRASLHYRNLRHGALVFLANGARWAGEKSAAFALLKQKAERQFIDYFRTTE